MKCLFHPEAEAELEQAAIFYEEYEEGLGFDFLLEVHSAVDRIISYPNAWTLMDDEIRRCLIKRFPYGILYTESSGEIIVLAIMHMHRDPDYWKKRL